MKEAISQQEHQHLLLVALAILRVILRARSSGRLAGCSALAWESPSASWVVALRFRTIFKEHINGNHRVPSACLRMNSSLVVQPPSCRAASSRIHNECFIVPSRNVTGNHSLLPCLFRISDWRAGSWIRAQLICHTDSSSSRHWIPDAILGNDKNNFTVVSVPCTPE